MRRDRIVDLNDARSGQQRPARRRPTEVPRHRPPAGLEWVGPVVRLHHRGRQQDFVLAGAMARALGTTRDSLLRLEATEVVPAAEFFVPGAWPGRGRQARCYPLAQVLEVAAWIDSRALRGRRLSFRRELVAPALCAIQARAVFAANTPLSPASTACVSA